MATKITVPKVATRKAAAAKKVSPVKSFGKAPVMKSTKVKMGMKGKAVKPAKAVKGPHKAAKFNQSAFTKQKKAVFGN